MNQTADDATPGATPLPVSPRADEAAVQKAAVQKAAADEIIPMHGWLYHFMFGSYGLFFRLNGLKVYGRENVPREGPFILAPNHVSLFDPPLVGVASPRLVTTMGKAELFEKKTCGLKILGFIIRRMGTFPVHRGKPDRRALRRAAQVLKAGGGLVIFPEGTRTTDGRLGPPELGIALIAHSAKAPVVPMYLKGTDRAFSKLHPGFRLIKPEAWFGPPLRFEEEYAQRGDRQTLHAISNRIMAEIARLRDVAEGVAPHDRPGAV
ncbi:MAG TPA: lysophospholipid acyltransferase family protein [Abditibacteriaceae bacterium]|nr:lysophospholipid acyltransferase family protein [Abditibacteriaceae bacterium]